MVTFVLNKHKQTLIYCPKGLHFQEGWSSLFLCLADIIYEAANNRTIATNC